MYNSDKINQTIKEFLEMNPTTSFSAKEISEMLISKKLLSDSPDRPEKQLRQWIRDKVVKSNFYHQSSKGSKYIFSISKENIDKIYINEQLSKNNPIPNVKKTRDNSDEEYIINLCELVLNEKAIRQATFDWLVGDSGRKLPVDAFFHKSNIIIEYHERQHTESVKHFDKGRTVSGVSRGEQRKKYDELRKKLIPLNGIMYIVLDYSIFSHTSSKKIIRNNDSALKLIRSIFKKIDDTIIVET